jgi:hypothetical protein
MELEKLFLAKTELPILHDNCFQIPIHPKLLDSNIKIREEIAREIFPQVAEEWKNDLKDYLPLERDLEKRKWYEEVFLKKREKIIRKNFSQFFGIWEDNTQTLDNGFVCGFSISRNAGGSLYFNQEEMNCQSFGNIYIKFSEDKRKEFENENKRIWTYAPHNIDYFPGALFLRNWAIKYMNEVFKEIFK